MNKIITIVVLALCAHLEAAELTHQFSSPAFSGVGFGTHVLTIKQLEDNQRAQNKSAADAIQARAEAAAANTPQAQFVANLQSRIYSQLAKQVTDSLFGATGAPTCTTAGDWCGTIDNLAGNTVHWKLGSGSDAGLIVIQINSLSNASQNATIKVPAGTFAF